MFHSPCCGVMMQNSTKPYDLVGQYKVKATTVANKKVIEYDTHIPVWKCPECDKMWAIERIVKGTRKDQLERIEAGRSMKENGENPKA